MSVFERNSREKAGEKTSSAVLQIVILIFSLQSAPPFSLTGLLFRHFFLSNVVSVNQIFLRLFSFHVPENNKTMQLTPIQLCFDNERKKGIEKFSLQLEYKIWPVSIQPFPISKNIDYLG